MVLGPHVGIGLFSLTFICFYLSGCQKGPHSNVKPEEPESITGKKDGRDLVITIEIVVSPRRNVKNLEYKVFTNRLINS